MPEDGQNPNIGGSRFEHLSIGAMVDRDAERYSTPRPFKGLDEDRLVAQAQAYDPVAIGELYERHLDSLYRYAYYRVGTQQDAEDLAEQTFTKAIIALPKYEDRGLPFSAWLYRIAHNEIASRFRKQPDVGAMSFEDKLYMEDGKPEPHLIESDSMERDEQLFANHQLSIALSELTGDQASVLKLKFVEGLSNLEVADILGKTEGAVKSLQHRALASIGRIMIANGYNSDEEAPLVDPSPSFEVDYSFTAAALRYPAHMLVYDIRHGNDPERVEQRRQIVEDVIIPFIDNDFVDPDQTQPADSTPDTLTDRLHKQVLYWLMWNEATITEIAKQLPDNLDPNAVLAEVRTRILDHAMEKTGMNFEELYSVLAGSSWINSISRRIRTNLAPILERRDRVKKPVKRKSSFLLKQRTEALEGMFGISEIDQLTRTLASTTPLLAKRGQILAPASGTTILVHQNRVLVTSEMRDHEIIAFKSPKTVKPEKGRPIVVSDYPYEAIRAHTPTCVTVDDCIIRLVHPEAHDIQPDLDDDEFNKVAQARRAELRDIFPDIQPAPIGDVIGIPIHEIERALLARFDSDSPVDDPGLAAAFRLLGQRHKRLLRLTYRDQLSDKEISQKMGYKRGNRFSPKAVGDARQRALTYLHGNLQSLELSEELNDFV